MTEQGATTTMTTTEEPMNAAERAMFERFGITPSAKKAAFRKTLSELDSAQLVAVCWAVDTAANMMTKPSDSDTPTQAAQRTEFLAFRDEICKGPDEAAQAFAKASDTMLDGIGWAIGVSHDSASETQQAGFTSLTRKHVADCGMDYDEYVKFAVALQMRERRAMIQRFIESLTGKPSDEAAQDADDEMDDAS